MRQLNRFEFQIKTGAILLNALETPVRLAELTAEDAIDPARCRSKAPEKSGKTPCGQKVCSGRSTRSLPFRESTSMKPEQLRVAALGFRQHCACRGALISARA
jgi:hypothetical protein